MNVSDLPLPRDWAEMLRRYGGFGWSPALLTFMFDHMAGDGQAIRRRQAAEVEEIYGRVVTRMVRRPASPSNQGCLPVWFCAPDFPIARRAKQRLSDVTINEGQHVHAIALTPPRVRLRSSFVTFVEEHQELLTRRLRCCRVHAEAVIDDLPRTFRYGMKTAMRLPDDNDGLFVLPRSRSEMREQPDRVGRNASLFGTAAHDEET